MEYVKLKLKDKSAQDMIEFCFVLPVLMFCFVFILVGGQLYYNKFVSFQAVYKGSRAASTEKYRSGAIWEMKQVAEEYAKQGIGIKTPISTDDVEIEYERGNSWRKGSMIKTSVTYNVNTLFPVNFSGGLRAANVIPITTSTVTYVEYDPENEYIGTRGY